MPDVMRRWLLHISIYEVEVVYRPGHGNADGLSHPPIIQDCQARDYICTQAWENLQLTKFILKSYVYYFHEMYWYITATIILVHT
jgi:hypothetical protein